MSDSCFRHFAARSGKEWTPITRCPLVSSGIFQLVKKRRACPFIYLVFCRLALAKSGRIVPEGDDDGQKSTEFGMGGPSLNVDT